MNLPPFPSDFRLLLASASPRRRDLLAAAGLPFTVVASDAVELVAGMEPRPLAEENALRKARGARVPDGVPDGAPDHPLGGALVLGADTLVVAGPRILGKPSGPADARAMLESLAGRDHEVITGVALVSVPPAAPGTGGLGGEYSVGSAVTVVRMRALSSAEIDAYVASGEWRDKAGGYAVQGLASLFVEEVRGDYTNVVGLPLSLVGALLRQRGFDPLTRRWLRG